MGIPVEQLTEAALALPSEARALLADRLAESLDPLTDPEIRKAWSEEALGRLREVSEGQVEAIPADEVLARIRKNLGR